MVGSQGLTDADQSDITVLSCWTKSLLASESQAALYLLSECLAIEAPTLPLQRRLTV